MGGKNNNGRRIGGDKLRITNVHVMAESITPIPSTNGLMATWGGGSFRLILSAYDPKSGLSRGTTDTTTQMNVTAVNMTTNNVTNYHASESSGDTTVNTASNVWQWSSLDGVTIQTLIDAGSNRVSANLYDTDIE